MTEDTNRKKIQTLFPNGYKGLADSRWSGVQGSVAEAVGIDAHSTPGILKVHQKLTFHSGEVIDELCENAVLLPDGKKLWFSSISGKIWIEINGTYTLVYTNEFPIFDIGTAVPSGNTFNYSSQSPGSFDAYIRADGLKMYLLNSSTTARVIEYNLSTAFEIDTMTFVQEYTVTQANLLQGLWFSSDGARMFVSSTSTDTIYSYTLSTPWDVSSATHDSLSFNVGTQDTNPRAIQLSNDGERMYVLGAQTNRVFLYQLSTPFDVSSATFDKQTIAFTGSVNGLYIHPDETRVYVSANMGDPTQSIVYQYAIQSNDIANLVLQRNIDFRPTSGIVQSMTLASNGSNMYLLTSFPTASLMYQYNISTVVDTDVITKGADILGNNVYWATKNKLLACSIPTDTSLLTTSTVGEFENKSDHHPMVVQNLQLYIGDGNVIAGVDTVGNFFPETDFKVEENEVILSLAPFDVDLLVGTQYRRNHGRILRWDTFSERWSAEDTVYEKGVRAFIHDDNFVYAYCGEQGQLYFYNGEKLEKINRIRGDWKNDTAIVKHQSVGFWKGLPLFALSSGSGTPCKMGIYTFGSYGFGYSKIMDLAFPINETFDNIQFGALIVDGVDFYISTPQGIFKLDYTQKYDKAFIETRQLMDEIDRSLLNTRTKYHINYVSLPENTNVGFSYRDKYASNFTAKTPVNDAKREQLVVNLSVPEISSLQLRFDFVVNENDAPEVESINII